MLMFYSVLTLPPIIPSGTVNEDKGSSSFSKRVKKKPQKQREAINIRSQLQVKFSSM